jgi:hypothetical protein
MMSRSLCLSALTGVLLCASSCIFAEDTFIADSSQELDMAVSGDQSGGADLGSPDLDTTDQDTPDDGGADMGCVPAAINAEQICDQLQRACGEAVVGDSCGGVQTVTCPNKCNDGEVCDEDSCVAMCSMPSDAELCERGFRPYECGVFTETICGAPRQYDCGTCKGIGQECQDGACSCTRASDETLCARRGVQCGEKTIADNCGMPYTVRCGGCGNERCNEDNTCPNCVESDDQFCARVGATCGVVSGKDRCGVMRQDVMCGGCDPGQVCTTQNTCACQGETDAELCAQQQPAAACGQVTRQDRCGVLRTADCGAPAQCPPGASPPSCSTTNQCCYPEDERAMQRMAYMANLRCGTLPATVCGQPQAIQVTCAGSDICCNGMCKPTLQCVLSGGDMGTDMPADMDMGSNTGKDMPADMDMGSNTSKDMPVATDLGASMDN